MVSTEVTLVGEIIPAPNTGPDTGFALLPGSTNEHPKYAQPMEYHLYDLAGDDLKLVFSPDVSYNDLWQNWTGQWVAVTGALTQPGVFQVKSFQATQAPAAATQTVGTPQATQNLHSERVTFIAQIINYPTISEHLFGYTYDLTDIMGNSKIVAVWFLPMCRTRITDLHGDQSDLRLLIRHWARFTGWVFRPQRSGYPQLNHEIVELQSVEEIPACAVMIAVAANSPARIGHVSTPKADPT